ncbi:PilN domain-containing protein [Kushneria indalinina]|uniref:Type IV pilus assembly protein PilN n=1 Tax=Kushneria indalinina DSM 14324 TaxID=1122140 RepID=A0A3D9DTN4_9GAMM|nr:PilN domain-containing protein [Kushneria indalinina]REC94123.1 type IV pilus assembly protein PilN [Kushneria indalinina DSM 14324]
MSTVIETPGDVQIDINLLPWREQARERRTRRFHLWLLLSALLGLGIGFLCQQYHQYQLSRIDADIAHIQQRTDALEHDITQGQALEEKRHQMQDRIELIRQLQFSRSQTVALFQALTDTLGDGVVYDRVERHDGQLDISGLATTNRQVSDQMRALSTAAVLGEPLLLDVRAESERSNQRRFNLQVPEHPLHDGQTPVPEASS